MHPYESTHDTQIKKAAVSWLIDAEESEMQSLKSINGNSP